MTFHRTVLYAADRPTHVSHFSQEGADPEELLRQMSIPDLAQNLDKAEGIYGAVHPQVLQLSMA